MNSTSFNLDYSFNRYLNSINTQSRTIKNYKQFIYLIIFLIVIQYNTVIDAVDSSRGSNGKAPVTTTNKELIAIEYGKKDLLNRTNVTKLLLCSTFIKADYKNLEVLYSNMNLMRDQCDWAVIFYGGDDDLMNLFCLAAKKDIIEYISVTNKMIKLNDTYNSHRLPLRIPSCKKAEASHQPKISIPVGDGFYVKQYLSIPKSVLYQELLTVLPHYHIAFLMDEDISLKGFSFTRFVRKWACAFWPNIAPMITQPLIAESTQYFEYVHEQVWKVDLQHKKRYSKAIAATVGLVEQQVPIFNAAFLEWYIKRVLINIKDVALKNGVDQSIDKTWCKAAEMYMKYVLHDMSSRKNYGCGIIISTPPVHHGNFQSLSNKRANRDLYREKAQIVNNHYKKIYPNWVLEDITRTISPIDVIYGKNYQIIKHINQSCVHEYNHNNSKLLEKSYF